jgi:hypothetical protein
MVPELVAFATSQGDVFTAEQARSAGYSRREIEQLRQSGHWVALRRGIYARREIVESANRSNRERHRLDIAAALLATAPGRAWASHQSAAVLWELEFLTRPDLTQVRLTRPGLDRSRAYRGLRLAPASLPVAHQAVCDAVPLTSGARTVIDLARESPFRDAVVLADSALRKHIATKSSYSRCCLTARAGQEFGTQGGLSPSLMLVASRSRSRSDVSCSLSWDCLRRSSSSGSTMPRDQSAGLTTCSRSTGPLSRLTGR